MTPEESPKEKAQEMFNKMYKAHSLSYSSITAHFSKQCAIIAVDEILNNEKERHSVLDGATEYWQEVREELVLLK